MPRILHFVLCLMVVLPLAAAAQQTELEMEMADCAAIKDDAERLDCYDALARERGLTTAADAVRIEGAGMWKGTEFTDPADGARHVVLTLPAAKGKSNWGKPISLVLACRGGRAELVILWNEYLGSKVRVTYRIDDGERVTDYWSLADDDHSTVYPGDMAALFSALRSAHELRADVTPYDEDPVSVTFDVRGLANSVSALGAPCGWR